MSDSDELANRMEIHRFSKDYEEEGFDESGYSFLSCVPIERASSVENCRLLPRGSSHFFIVLSDQDHLVLFSWYISSRKIFPNFGRNLVIRHFVHSFNLDD